MATKAKFLKHQGLRRILTILLLVIILALLLTYGALSMAHNSAGFTVKLNARGLHSAQISLSETADFAVATDTLLCEVPEAMKDICGKMIPKDIDETDGQHNKDLYYIAYTFYVRNVGNESCTLEESMAINSEVKGVSDAIRVRVYRDGEKTDYAKATADGSLEEEYCDVAFADDQTVFSIKTEDFEPSTTIKYTVVIWLEGDDDQCVNQIRGGNVKLSMSFNVSEGSH